MSCGGRRCLHLLLINYVHYLFVPIAVKNLFILVRGYMLRVYAIFNFICFVFRNVYLEAKFVRCP